MRWRSHAAQPLTPPTPRQLANVVWGSVAWGGGWANLGSGGFVGGLGATLAGLLVLSGRDGKGKEAGAVGSHA